MQKKYDTYLTCVKCNNNYISKYSNYCPICGGNKLKKGVGFMIYKTEINLDENKKAKICPKCGNEEILEGKYCKICGFELFNRCTNYNQDENNGIECNEICDANARFCHKCGSETLFYVENLLCDYNKYDNNKENFKEIWQDILSELKNSGKIMLYANLLDSEFSEINSNTVRLSFKNTNEFKKVLLSKEENIKILKDILKEKYEKEMSIKLYDSKDKLYFYEDIVFEPILSTSSDDLPF